MCVHVICWFKCCVELFHRIPELHVSDNVSKNFFAVVDADQQQYFYSRLKFLHVHSASDQDQGRYSRPTFSTSPFVWVAKTTMVCVVVHFQLLFT